MIWYKKVGLYVISGLLLGVGFVFSLLWPLGILGAALLLHRLLVSNDSWVAKLAGAYGAMFIKFLFVLAFYWTMYPIEWLPFDFGSGELAIVALYWVSVASFLAWSGCALYVLVYISKKIVAPKWVSMGVFIPIAWILSELFGSLTLSLFTLGPGSSPNISFSLGYIGYLLGEHQFLAQLARVGGVYVLSFATVICAVGTMQLWPQWKKKEKAVLIAILVFFATTTNLSLPVTEAENTMTTIALISTSMPVEDLFERKNIEVYRNAQAAAMESALATDASYIIWPEDARYFYQLAGSMGTSVFSFVHADANVVVIDSGVTNTELGNAARAHIVDVAAKQNYSADKRYLVPQGEFMPYLYYGLFHVIGLGDMAEKVAGAVSYVIGPQTSQKEFASNIPGVLFCFESSDATGVRSLMNERENVPFIAHPVSHIWFHEPQSFWSQLDTSLRVQAIWNQVYIASAANHAPSKLFTPNGTIVLPQKIASGEYWEVGTVTVPVQ